MGFLQTLQECFPTGEKQAEENLYLFSARYSCNANNFPQYCEIKKCLSEVSPRDIVKAKISFEEEYEFDLVHCDKASYNNYIQEYSDEALTVKIEIEKEISNDCISVYSLVLLSSYFEKLSIWRGLCVFAGLMKKQRNSLCFEILDAIDIMFCTSSFLFVSSEHKPTITSFNRGERLTLCRTVSSFQNSDLSVLLPDDFHVISQTNECPDVQHIEPLFRKMCSILSIAYLANYVQIDERHLQFKFEGNMHLEQCEKLEDIKENETLYKIYDWVYNEVHAEDKLLIARNAIVFHGAAGKQVACIGDEVFQSVCVEFSLYLKKNAKQFIEAKNKLGQFICDLVSKLDQYTIGILDKFKANLMAIGIFLFTTAIVNIASEQPLNNILTPDIMGILTIFFLASIIYMVVCNYEVEEQMKMTQNAYDNLRESYKDVLTSDEIEQIFSEKNGINERMQVARQKKLTYIIIWVIILIVLYIILCFLSGGVSFNNIVSIASLEQTTRETASYK